jgi:putative flippase GtrA
MTDAVLDFVQRLPAAPALGAFARRFRVYCVVGASAFSADYSIFLLLIGAKASPYLANMIGISAGIAVSFSLNRKYNFRKPDATALRAARFIAVALAGMAVSTLAIALLLSCGVDVHLTKAAAMVFVFGLQFLANALWTFR